MNSCKKNYGDIFKTLSGISIGVSVIIGVEKRIGAHCTAKWRAGDPKTWESYSFGLYNPMKKYKSSTFKIVEKVPTGGGIALKVVILYVNELQKKPLKQSSLRRCLPPLALFPIF